MASEAMARDWVRMPGLRGYVLLSMVLHVLLFAAVSQYRSTHGITQMPPVLVRLVPPFPAPLIKGPVSETAPEVMRSAPDATGIEKALEEHRRQPVQDSAEAIARGEPAPRVADDLDGPEPIGEEDHFPGRDAIFDSEVIARHAEEPAEPIGGETGITFDTSGVALSGYMKRLKHKIENAWVYPYSATKDGIYGDLKMSFVIRRDGTLGEVRVLRTSGHAVLDEAAMKALRNAEPFWPLPELFKKEALRVDGRFIYSLSGRYVR